MTGEIKREVGLLSDARPTWDANGVPFCPSDECKCYQYDGKRCRLTGFRPGSVCEPAVRTMADLLNRRTHA